MRTALGASGIVLAALAIGCGGGAKNDHDAIEQLWADYFGAFEDGNAGDAADLYSSACTNAASQLETLMNASEAVRDDTSIDVTGVEIQNNTGSAAESIPIGTITFAGTEQEMESGGFTPVVKESGSWKFENCDILGGGGTIDQGASQ